MAVDENERRAREEARAAALEEAAKHVDSRISGRGDPFVEQALKDMVREIRALAGKERDDV